MLVVWGDQDQIFPLEMAHELKEYEHCTPLLGFTLQNFYLFYKAVSLNNEVNCLLFLAICDFQASWEENKAGSNTEHISCTPD